MGRKVYTQVVTIYKRWFCGEIDVYPFGLSSDWVGVRTAEELKPLLGSDEKVLGSVRQSYISSLSPDTIVATNKRILVVHYSFWGLHARHNLFSSTDIGIVYYNHIISFDMERGKLLATIHLRLRGSGGIGSVLDTWSITGVYQINAIEFLKIVQKVLEQFDIRVIAPQQSYMQPSFSRA